MISLKIIFEFCEDYTNYVYYRIDQELKLTPINTSCTNALIADET